MIEFTTLELTLSVLCVGLFLQGLHYCIKARSMFRLISAMCLDDDVLKKVKQVHNESGQS